MTPECELECELQYQICLKCKDREGCRFGEVVIDFWEDRKVKEFNRKVEENGMLDIRKLSR